MSLRRFPLPLLLLTVALTPADATRGLNNTSAPASAQIASCSQQAAGCAARGSASWRRRRAAFAGQHQVSEDALLQASYYLRCRSEGRPPEPSLRQAWDSFHAGCDAAIRRYAASCRLRGADLEDCAQEVWSDLVGSLRTFQFDRSRGSFDSWLYRVVHSKAVDIKRRQARRPSVTLSAGLSEALRDPGLTPLAHQEREEDRAALRLALFRLQRHASPESYQVLHLRQMEGWSVRQVADALGLTAEQVWAREHRMKRKLQELLRSHGLMRLPRGNLKGAQVDVA